MTKEQNQETKLVNCYECKNLLTSKADINRDPCKKGLIKLCKEEANHEARLCWRCFKSAKACRKYEYVCHHCNNSLKYDNDIHRDLCSKGLAALCKSTFHTAKLCMKCFEIEYKLLADDDRLWFK